LKILHITNWYPSEPCPNFAKWIKNQIESINSKAENKVFHFQIDRGKFRLKRGSNTDDSKYLIIYLPFEIWRINELLSFIFVLFLLIKNKKKKIDIINFHIAYPNCTYIHRIRRWINIPVVISEHWSAYHFDFNIKLPAKRRRIQKIFQQEIPVIAVSNALIKDISNFSQSAFPAYVIYNIVNTQVFNYTSGDVSIWARKPILGTSVSVFAGIVAIT